MANAIRWKRVKTIKVNEFQLRSRQREKRNSHMRSYFHFIPMSFAVLLYGVKTLHSSSILALRILYGGQSFISFVLSITNSKCYFYHMCCSPKLLTEERNYLGWWVLYKCIAMALSTVYTFVRVEWHDSFLMMYNIYLDLFMHAIYVLERVKKRVQAFTYLNGIDALSLQQSSHSHHF